VNAADVIDMRMRRDDQTDVFDPETEAADVPIDLFRRLRQPAVEKDVPALRCNENGRQSGRPDVVRVAEDAERIERRVPLRAALAQDGRIRPERRANLRIRQRRERDEGEKAADYGLITLIVR